MKLGIMQPYFLPYIGYFELIYRSDAWVVFDTAQYIRHGWVNRNRILHPNHGWQYVIVPVQKHAQTTPIKDVNIAEGRAWKERIVGQLQHYKKRAPFFQPVLDIVRLCLETPEKSISVLNVRCLEIVCSYLGIPFRYSYFSQLNLPLGPVQEPGDWALRISEALNASEYINPPGGAELFDRSKFDAAGIRLSIQEPVDFTYECDGYTFEPNLSIVDVLMWNSAHVVRSYLQSRLEQRQQLA